MSGVPGGGRMSENSDARVLMGDGASDKAKRTLTFWERRDTSVCGSRSFAKPNEIEMK